MSELVSSSFGSKLNLSRSQSDSMVVSMMMRKRFVVASWKLGEPIVSGVGDTAWSARNMALMCGESHDALEVCERIPGELAAWRGPSGRIVTIEHLLTIDE